MLHELKPREFERVRSLFQGFDYSLSVFAAIEGNNPGRIFVDDAKRPETALALTVEGYLLGGDHENRATNEALRTFLRDKIFTGEVYVNGDWSLSLALHPQAPWEAKLPGLIPGYDVQKNQRYFYLCRALHFDWRRHVPEGYTVHIVDRRLLSDPAITFSDEISDWMDIEEMWGTEENFLENGISTVVVFDGQVVTWCTPDCWAGERMDVGIITHPDHRRQGLASVAVAATVERCLAHGYSAVGWHCNANNSGSWKTAEKVGFECQREYDYYFYIYDPIDHLASMGWYYYRRGEYARTVEYYDQVFMQREENPDYYYHLVASAWALLENKEQALRYLQAAVEHGWANADFSRQVEEFGILHEDPAWDSILEQMEQT